MREGETEEMMDESKESFDGAAIKKSKAVQRNYFGIPYRFDFLGILKQHPPIVVTIKMTQAHRYGAVTLKSYLGCSHHLNRWLPFPW